jgi:hypothetical protein
MDRSPSTAATAPASKSTPMPTPEAASPTPPSPQQPVSPLSLPEVNTPPAKRTRRQHNGVELLRGLEGEGELLLSPLSCTASLLPFLPPSSSSSHMSSTASLPLLLPAPLDLELVSSVSGPLRRPHSRHCHLRRWHPLQGSASWSALAFAFTVAYASACSKHHPSRTSDVHPFSVSLL